MSIVDARERLQALDPLHSFCVTAPAGSGKTELLIQRMLGLLARVDQPEQVLAITFTRKAAAEMRERLLAALREAQIGAPCQSPHQQLTRELAVAALEADATGNWQLVQNISRLNIKTIDGFCGQLTRQMPILSEFGGAAEVIDDATELYAEAATELFDLVGQTHPLAEDLAALMLHFDNDWSKFQTLLISMLGRRDQWSSYIGVHHEPDEAEAYLISTVDNIIADTLENLREHLSRQAGELLSLAGYAADNLGAPPVAEFPGTAIEDVPTWRFIRGMLLTKAGKWRASVTVRDGFPPGKGANDEQKQRLKALLALLKDNDALLASLNAIAVLPEVSSGSQSWQLVLHLSRVLPRLAAELLLVFARRGQVDYSQVALSALQALGNDEAPTELALRLDYQLEHILVDEFQDTAINQYELVRRLTRGWAEHNEDNPGKPRTLLIVGDGMQSIYGFRDANVGLFISAKNQGFNGVSLTPIALRSNFRSDEGVVDWVNGTFSKAFPAVENLAKGQINFTSAVPVREPGTGTAVSLNAYSGDNAAQLELDQILATVQMALLDDDCKTLAILARTRSHLQSIIAGLKSLDIAYSAQDIDTLADSVVVTDLLTLCRALNNPADRLAWMSLLRAPWCGLSLADLHLVGTVGDYPAHTAVYSSLSDTSLLEQLSPEGRLRVSHVRAAIYQAQLHRDRLPLRQWIEQLWLNLGGVSCQSELARLHDAERFFQLLEQADNEGQGLSMPWLQNRLKKLYVQAENPDSKVQLMTLHKAKGLEFDWVIIPSAAKTIRASSKPLLLWDDYYSASGERGFLLAADDHSQPGDPSLYNWLKAQAAEKEVLEATRLLYVGTTRAVKKLFISAGIKPDKKGEGYQAPPEKSLLASIWPSFERQMQVRESDDDVVVINTADATRPLRRLPASTLTKMAGDRLQPEEPDASGKILPLTNLNPVQRHVGTVVHYALEQFAARQNLPQSPAPEDLQLWKMELSRLGIFDTARAEAMDRVTHAVGSVLNDPIGRWILSSSHPEARSELALTMVDDEGSARDIIIDRTFVDEDSGQRWIVDYKNSQPAEDETLEAFVARELSSYKPQLAIYAQAMTALTGEPVKCALYFTSVGEFAELD
ncbi:MAG: UvrD-helicase domain-containing protein [Halioglobus sp.]